MKKELSGGYRSPLWKHFANVEYIEIDLTDLPSEEDVIKCVSEAVEMGLQREAKSVRALVYVKNLKVSPQSMRAIKKLGKMVQPKLKKSALVGSVGMMSFLMKLYTSYTGSKIKFFTDKDAAIKYLIKE